MPRLVTPLRYRNRPLRRSPPSPSPVPSWRKPSIRHGEGGGGERGRGPRSAISLRITYSAAMRRLCPPAFPTDPPPFRKGFLRLTNTSSEGDASVERDCLLSALLPRPRRILIFRGFGKPGRDGKKRKRRRRRKEARFFYRPPCGLDRHQDEGEGKLQVYSNTRIESCRISSKNFAGINFVPRVRILHHSLLYIYIYLFPFEFN